MVTEKGKIFAAGSVPMLPTDPPLLRVFRASLQSSQSSHTLDSGNRHTMHNEAMGSGIDTYLESRHRCWGSQARKIRAAYQFFPCTLFGTVFMLS